MKLHDQFGRDAADRTELFDGVAADEPVNLADFSIIQTRICLGKRHQLVAMPEAEGIIGVETCPSARTPLGIEKYAIDAVRLYFPLPPVASLPSHSIRRAVVFQHKALDLEFPALSALFIQPLPAPARHQWRQS